MVRSHYRPPNSLVSMLPGASTPAHSAVHSQASYAHSSPPPTGGVRRAFYHQSHDRAAAVSMTTSTRHARRAGDNAHACGIGSDARRWWLDFPRAPASTSRADVVAAAGIGVLDRPPHRGPSQPSAGRVRRRLPRARSYTRAPGNGTDLRTARHRGTRGSGLANGRGWTDGTAGPGTERRNRTRAGPFPGQFNRPAANRT